MNYPKVSIIILNWNGLKDTIECLDSLKKITYPNYEVIVVDNGSEGNDADILEEKYKDYVKVIKNKENLGFTGGNNVGIRRTLGEGKSDYILLLNNDTTVEPNFLNELIKTALQDEKIAVIGSVIADYYTKKTTFMNSKIDKKLKAEARLDYLNSDKNWWETGRVHGASMMIRSEYLLRYSFFLDEDLFLYCDELDLCLRARKHGLKVAIAGKSKVYHKGEFSLNKIQNPINIYYIVRNRILLAGKMLSIKDRIIFWILFVPARLVRCIKWAFRGRLDLLKITFLAFNDGIKKKAGKNKKHLF